jgi:hypothetical protein
MVGVGSLAATQLLFAAAGASLHARTLYVFALAEFAAAMLAISTRAIVVRRLISLPLGEPALM